MATEREKLKMKMVIREKETLTITFVREETDNTDGKREGDTERKS